jgi:indolepyruvate ferredoxin oxidoreductase
MSAFKVLARFKFLRGTPLDPFGYSSERRRERQSIADYQGLLAVLSDMVGPTNHVLAVQLASLPEKIRGYGHVKERHRVAAKAEEAALREQFAAGSAPFLKAAE